MPSFFALCITLLATALPVVAQTRIERLAPDQFSWLPKAVRGTLAKSGCAIPQDIEALEAGRRGGAIQGHFVAPQRIDVAALCSIAGGSRILIVHSGTGTVLAALAEAPDEQYLQSWTKGEYVFSRRISRVSPKQLARAVRKANGPPPERWRAGIDDHFVGKASVIHYFRNGSWRTAPGAD